MDGNIDHGASHLKFGKCISILSAFLFLFTAQDCRALPSITSDGTTGTVVEIDGSKYTIKDGTILDGNQFHSFARFNIFKGESANFNGPAYIENIIGRLHIHVHRL